MLTWCWHDTTSPKAVVLHSACGTWSCRFSMSVSPLVSPLSLEVIPTSLLFVTSPEAFAGAKWQAEALASTSIKIAAQIKTGLSDCCKPVQIYSKHVLSKQVQPNNPFHVSQEWFDNKVGRGQGWKWHKVTNQCKIQIDARHSRHRSEIGFCHGYFGILSGRGWLRDSMTQIPAGPISSGAGHGKSAKSQARESEANRGNLSVRWSSKVFLTEPEKQKAHVIKITIKTDQNYIKLPSSHEFDLFSRIHHEGPREPQPF